MSPVLSDLAREILMAMWACERRFFACDSDGRVDPLELPDLCSRFGAREASLNEAIRELLQKGYLQVSVADFEGVEATGLLGIVESEYPF